MHLTPYMTAGSSSSNSLVRGRNVSSSQMRTTPRISISSSTFLRPHHVCRNSGLFQISSSAPSCAESNSWEVLGFIVLSRLKLKKSQIEGVAPPFAFSKQRSHNIEGPVPYAGCTPSSHCRDLHGLGRGFARALPGDTFGAGLL